MEAKSTALNRLRSVVAATLPQIDEALRDVAREQDDLRADMFEGLACAFYACVYVRDHGGRSWDALAEPYRRAYRDLARQILDGEEPQADAYLVDAVRMVARAMGFEIPEASTGAEAA